MKNPADALCLRDSSFHILHFTKFFILHSSFFINLITFAPENQKHP